MGNEQSIQSYDIPRRPAPNVPSYIQQHKRWLELVCCACKTGFKVSLTIHATYCMYTLHLESEILDICTIDIYAFNINGYESYIIRLNDHYGDPSMLNSIAPSPAHINTYEFDNIKQWYTRYPSKKLETMREVGQEILNICGNSTVCATFLLQ